MNAGQSYPVTVTMRNTGTTPWTEATQIRLGGVGDGTGDAAKFGPTRISIQGGNSVAAGAQYTFSFTMTAPAQGTYNPKYKMVWDGHQWFGDQLSKTVTVNSVSTVNAQVVSDTIPTTMNAGQSYPVTVTMRNTGTTPWTEATQIRLGGVGDGTGDAAKFGPTRISIQGGNSVAAGAQYTFSFTMTAPAQGTYNPKYKMVWDGHQWFGDQLSRSVQVSNSGGTVPTAAFTSNKQSGTKPLTVQFTDQSAGTAPLSCAWDFTNDGITDSNIQNPSYTYSTEGTYSVRLTVTNTAGSHTLIKYNYITVSGTSSYVPVINDFDGNSTDDLGVFRSDGNWYLDYNFDNVTDHSFRFGKYGDIPVTGDWNGNSIGDIGVFRPSNGNWYHEYNKNGASFYMFHFGKSGDIPVTGDWNGNGITDVGVFRPSNGNWYLDYFSTGTISSSFHFGKSGDVPVIGDWNGNNIADVGVFRPSTTYWYLDTTKTGVVATSIKFGEPGDIPVVGDWNGDKSTDIGVFRPSTSYWHIDYNKDGYIDDSVQFGFTGVIPIVGDWNGDGTDGIGWYYPDPMDQFLKFNNNAKLAGAGAFKIRQSIK
jgi:PKD repeat protein